jgi:hypothetical protein
MNPRCYKPLEGVDCWAGLGWAGLGWAGLGWAGLGWAGLGWAGLGDCLIGTSSKYYIRRQSRISKYVKTSHGVF